MPDESARRDGPETAETPRVRPWASLASPPFRLLLGTFSLGSFGEQMRQVTNLFVVYALSGSTLQVGLLGIFQFVPLVVFGLLGGSLADTLDRKKLVVFAQAGNLAMAVMLTVLALSGSLEVWHIYASTLITTGTSMFDQPARMGLIYAVVPRAHLMNAITLNTSLRHGTQMLGPILGGTLLDWQGAAGAYGINAVLLLPVVLGLLTLRVPQAALPAPSRKAMAPREMLAGFKFFFSTQIILALIVMDLVGNLLGAYRVVMPSFSEDILMLDSSGLGLGLLLSAPAAGFLFGSTVLLAVGNVQRKGVLVLVTFIGFALALALFAVSRSFPLSLAAMAMVGALDGIGVITRQTTMQLLVPDAIRGRATAALQMTNRGAPSAGLVITGALADAIGPPEALLLGSVISIGLAFVVLIFWREVTRFKS